MNKIIFFVFCVICFFYYYSREYRHYFMGIHEKVAMNGARVLHYEGSIKILHHEKEVKILSHLLQKSDAICTGNKSSVIISLGLGAQMKVLSESKISLIDGSNVWRLEKGGIFINNSTLIPNPVKIMTSLLEIEPQKTNFLLLVGKSGSFGRIAVKEGNVSVKVLDNNEVMVVGAGEGAFVDEMEQIGRPAFYPWLSKIDWNLLNKDIEDHSAPITWKR